jgi:proteasome lid subunit RPN8/RPN11
MALKKIGRIKFLKPQFKALQSESEKLAKSGGREICGLILDNGYFLELISIRNKVNRGGGFAFYFQDVRAICKWAKLSKHTVVGTFHSHPLGVAQPGPADLHNAVEDSLMLIFDVTGRSGALWIIKNKTKKKRLFVLV